MNALAHLSNLSISSSPSAMIQFAVFLLSSSPAATIR